MLLEAAPALLGQVDPVLDAATCGSRLGSPKAGGSYARSPRSTRTSGPAGPSPACSGATATIAATAWPRPRPSTTSSPAPAAGVTPGRTPSARATRATSARRTSPSPRPAWTCCSGRRSPPGRAPCSVDPPRRRDRGSPAHSEMVQSGSTSDSASEGWRFEPSSRSAMPS